jgi:aminoglycoside phosphotransferase (APT) family kinase protein
VVIDLDEARMGDPAADVAHFCAYLDATGRLDHSALHDAFLTGYGPLPGDAPELRVALHAARTALKIAKQLACGRGPLRPGGNPARAAALDAALARGWACLPA